MPKINATEFQKRLGEYSDVARREPVTVTKHGRPSLVLMSAEDYDRLKAFEARATKVRKATELRPSTIRAIKNADLSHLPRK